MDQVLAQNLSPIRFADDSGTPTEVYPQNPTGGQHGIASLCSPDGRHLAMMPHPERCFQTWQWPWMPSGWDAMESGPWLKLFQNAQKFCEATAE